jgi:hypothetical protein
MKESIPAKVRLLSTSLLLAGWGLLCGFAPWRQVHPADASLGHDLSRAPIWSHAYQGMPGAKLDGAEFLLESGAVLLACLLLLGFYRSMRTLPSR